MTKIAAAKWVCIAAVLAALTTAAQAESVDLAAARKEREEVAMNVKNAETLLEKLRANVGNNTAEAREEKTKKLAAIGKEIGDTRQMLTGLAGDELPPRPATTAPATLPAEVEAFIATDPRITAMLTDRVAAERNLAIAQKNKPEAVAEIQKRVDAATAQLEETRNAMRESLAAKMAADDGASVRELIKKLSELSVQYAALSRELAMATNSDLKIQVVETELELQRKALADLDAKIAYLERQK